MIAMCAGHSHCSISRLRTRFPAFAEAAAAKGDAAKSDALRKHWLPLVCSFRRYVSRGSLQVHVWLQDAMQLLQDESSEFGSLCFDFVDTGRLIDHVGLWNIAALTARRLRKADHSQIAGIRWESRRFCVGAELVP